MNNEKADRLGRTPAQINYDHRYLQLRLSDLKHLRDTVKVREDELLEFSKRYKMRIDMDALTVEDWGDF